MNSELQSTGGTESGGPRAFETTRWSVVLSAADPSSPEGRAALGKLCRDYWKPLYRFVRCRGASPHDAQDLTQGFFEELLERGTIARADASRGRFRTFLITSLKNHLVNERTRAGRLKRGGGTLIVPLDAARDDAPSEPAASTSDTPESLYDRQWAHSLIATVLERLRAEHAASGRLEQFVVLRDVIWNGSDAGGHAAIARRLGSTEGAVRVAVHRLRQRFRDALRDEVARTVSDPAEVDDEIRHLLGSLRA